MTKTRGTVLSLVAVLAAGCTTLEPSLLLPPPPVAASWPLPETTAPSGKLTAEPSTPVADIGWRDFFVDPHLEQLIELALANNRDLRVAVLNVERARALHDIRRADQLPSVAGGAAYSRQRLSSPSQAGGARGATVSQASVEVGITSYELDLFGRVRSLSHSALEQFFASEEARRGAQLGLIAAVADTYLTLAADRELERLAAQTVASEEASFGLTKQRYERGAVSGLEVSQAETTVANARVDAARFAGRRTGRERVGVSDRRAGRPGVAACRFRHRRQWRRAAARWPARRDPVAPPGRRGRRAPVAGGQRQHRRCSRRLLSAHRSHRQRWHGEQPARRPVRCRQWVLALRAADQRADFQGGRLRANRRAAEIDRDIALAGYERAIQGAFREVADALALERSLARQREAQQGLVSAAGRAFELSRARHESGRDSYLVALDSQRISYGSQQGLIVLRLAEQLNRIALYRALGGGWQERSEWRDDARADDRSPRAERPGLCPA